MTKPDHDTGSHLPYSMREMLEVFHVPTNQSAGDGTYSLSGTRRLEYLTIRRCHNKGNTFSSVVLKTLSVDPASTSRQ